MKEIKILYLDGTEEIIDEAYLGNKPVESNEDLFRSILDIEAALNMKDPHRKKKINYEALTDELGIKFPEPIITVINIAKPVQSMTMDKITDYIFSFENGININVYDGNHNVAISDPHKLVQDVNDILGAVLEMSRRHIAIRCECPNFNIDCAKDLIIANQKERLEELKNKPESKVNIILIRQLEEELQLRTFKS